MIPPPVLLRSDTPILARIVSASSFLPNPETVAALGRPAFPTVRARSKHPRYSLVRNDTGEAVGMYDDNMPPIWALLWAHGEDYRNEFCKGWCFAHVWTVADDINAYTHPANLVLIPECFASLTDKNGPLTIFLQWHAWTTYGWKPESFAEPSKPEGYDEIFWNYLERFNRPKEFIRDRVISLRNQRVEILRPIMQRLGMI